MVLALITALGTTVSVLTINNLQSSWRAQQAGSALNAADAGIAQAVTYLRSTGVNGLNCANPTCPPVKLTGTVPGKAGQSFEVTIEMVDAYPASNPGTYRVTTVGRAAGAAMRSVSVDLSVTAGKVPRGIFARTVAGSGAAEVSNQSVFSTGCVVRRSQIKMVKGQLDLAYGLPIGVHTSQYISDHNSCDMKRIHPPVCDPDYPYDHDRAGGLPPAGSACATAQQPYPDYYAKSDLNGDGAIDVQGSYLRDDNALFELFEISPRLPDDLIDRLRTVAISQGNFHTESSGWQPPEPDNEPHSVMFFDLTDTDPGGVVNLNQISNYLPSPSCTPRSLVIVVAGGNVKMNSNLRLLASIFLTSNHPHGSISSNGNAELTGTVYADSISLGGTTEFGIDKCFMDNPSPSLLDIRVSNYRENDR
ncbi:hypothetical protein GCM10027026_23310 [Myroides odoratimimus subsp. xuanwuensis]